MLLKDIASVKGGKRLPKTDQLVSYKTNHPYIRIRDMYQSYPLQLNDDFEYITDDTYEKIKRYTVEQGDVILAVVGNTIGLVSLIGESLDGANLTENCNKIVDLQQYDNKFLYYYLTSKQGQEEIKKGIIGSSQPKLPIYNIEKFEIPEISLDSQKKIVSVLETIDKKININEKINNNLEQQARTIYQNMFENIDSLPAGWHKVPLGEVINISNKSFNPLKEPETLLEHYSIPAYDDAKFPVFELSTEIKSNKFIIDDSCFMISKLNPTTKRVWRPYCLTNNAVCSTEFIVYKAKEESLTDYLYSVINSDSFSEFMCSHVTGSTGSRQRTTPKDTLFFEVLVPTEEELETFKTTVAPMYAQMRNIAIENNKLKETRDALLPRLMSGEIDVSNV